MPEVCVSLLKFFVGQASSLTSSRNTSFSGFQTRPTVLPPV
jgi:hypothetical protein